MSPSDNPFRASRLIPGTLPHLSNDGTPTDLDALISTIRPGRPAAIVGPHGTGKTTLLRRLAAKDPTLSVRDSFDRLAFAVRGAIRWSAVLRHHRLVVTAHRAPRGFAVLHRSGCSEVICDAVIRRLAGQQPAVVRGAIDRRVATWEIRPDTDLRSRLFELYDVVAAT